LAFSWRSSFAVVSFLEHNIFVELICPSCGARHRSEDHPQAFEINCVCGYSILVPDEQAFTTEEPAVDEPASSAQNVDEDFVIPQPSGIKAPLLDPASDPAILESRGTLDMTPPEDLPSEMVYDPFELPQVPELPAEPMLESPPNSITKIRSKPDPLIETTTAQSIVDRVQLASVGQLVGALYKVECQGLDSDALAAVAARAKKLLAARPWLDNELKRHGVSVDSLASSPSLERVPEMLAVEIYLACFELGGRCAFEKMT
jgi:hypothetical protein